MALGDQVGNERRNSNDENWSAVLRAIENAAVAAQIGDNLRAILREVAIGFLSAAPAETNIPGNQYVVVSTTDTSSIRAKTGTIELSPDIFNRAIFVLHVLSQSQRTELIGRLARDQDQLARAIAAWLQTGPPNILLQTASFFGTKREALPILESKLNQSVECLLSCDFMQRMQTIHAYLNHKLAPTAREKHLVRRPDGSTVLSEHDLFLDLQQDPCFTDFINEMPRLIAEAALSIYRVLVPTLPAADRNNERNFIDNNDEREVASFLHLLCCQIEMAREATNHSIRSDLEIEACCYSRVAHSAANALYLDFLNRKCPRLLTPIPPDDDVAADEVDNSFKCLEAIVRSVQGRLNDNKVAPASPNIAAFRLMSSELLRALATLSNWLFDIVDDGGYFDLSVDFPRGSDGFKRSLESQPWIRAATITCRRQGETVETIDTTYTRNTPSVGHGISTMRSAYSANESGGFDLSVNCGCWCHTPTGHPQHLLR